MAVPSTSCIHVCQFMQAPSFPDYRGMRLAVEGGFWVKEGWQ